MKVREANENDMVQEIGRNSQKLAGKVPAPHGVETIKTGWLQLELKLWCYCKDLRQSAVWNGTSETV